MHKLPEEWREKLPAAGRKILIAVLMISALLLLRETGLIPVIAGRLRAGEHADAVGNGADADTKPAGMAQPLAAVVCGADGGRYGAAYDREAVMAVFQRFSMDIVEALGSAGTPELITQEAFQEYLSRSGVLLRFYGAQPMALLSAWLGGEMRGEAASYRAELLCLCADGEGVALCFRTEAGAYFRCSTAVPQEGLQSRVAEYTPNGAGYAFEQPSLPSGRDGCAVIMDGAVRTAVVQRSVSLPSGAELEALLQAVGMNSYNARSYTEADGTVVYVGDEMTLRLSSAGKVFFHRSGAAPDGSPDVTDAVTAAWRLAEQSIGKSCGDAALLLAGVKVNEEQRMCTVLLDYAVNGIPVRLSSGHAAEIIFRDGVPMQASLEFRRYTLTEEKDTLLPALQVAAMAAAENAAAELIYADDGDAMHCVWVRSDG